MTAKEIEVMQKALVEIERLREENRLVTEQNRLLNEELLKSEREIERLDWELDAVQSDPTAEVERLREDGKILAQSVTELENIRAKLLAQLSTSRQEGWQPGSEKPENDGEYLVAYRYFGTRPVIGTAYFMERGWNVQSGVTIDFWMPIPNLPEAK